MLNFFSTFSFRYIDATFCVVVANKNKAQTKLLELQKKIG